MTLLQAATLLKQRGGKRHSKNDKAELKDFLQSRLTEQSNGKYLINEIGEKFAKTE